MRGKQRQDGRKGNRHLFCEAPFGPAEPGKAVCGLYSRRRGADRIVQVSGLTLTELVIALVITSIIAGTTATMMFSISSATGSQEQARGLLVCHATVGTRIGQAVRAAKMVLAAGKDYLVLWNAETHPDGVPHLSELRRIERSPSTNELWSFQAAPNLAEADNTEYSLASTDFNAVTAALRGTNSFPGELWATDVTAWSIGLDAAGPQAARFVGYRIVVTLDGISETLVGGAALRN